MAASLPPMGPNCATSLGLQNLKPGTVNDTEQSLTIAEASTTVAWDISQIGWSLLLADTPALPLIPLISLGFAIDAIVSAFSGGRPKMEDTYNVINAYNQSKYWPLHALATDLAIAAKNGAPISDSGPAIQARFSALKLGTIESIQQLAGWPAGEASPGFWQLQRLINASWALSGQGEPAVLNAVRAIDRFAEILGCLRAQVKNLPPPPPAPPPAPPQCEGFDPDTDEPLDSCYATQYMLGQILQAIEKLGGATQTSGGDACCNKVVVGIAQVVRELTIIAQAAVFAEKGQAQIDLSPLVAAIAALAAAIPNYTPLFESCCKELNASLASIATAVSNHPATDTAGIVDQLKQIVGQGDVDQSIFNALNQAGFLTSADLQVLQGIKWSDALTYIESTRAARDVMHWAKVFGTDAEAIGNSVAAKLAPIGNWVERMIVGALTFERNVIQDALSPLIDIVTSALKPAGPTMIGNIGVNPDKVLADIVAVGVNARVLEALVALKFPGVAERLENITEIATGLLSLDEIRDVQVGPLVRHGIQRIAEMQAKAIFKQEIPGAGAAASMYARGIIPQSGYEAIAGYSGLPDILLEPTHLAAQGGISAFILIRLLETGLFTAADLRDELTFSGIRPRSQQRLIAGAAYLATATQRKALESAMEKAYVAGIYSDQDLLAGIDSAEQNTDMKSLTLKTVQLEKLIAETKALESEYTTLFLAGLFSDQQYRGYLDGIGLQPDMVNMVAGKAEARANATLHKKQLAEAARMERETAAIERRTAIKNFLEGNLSAPLLEAALVATGLTATQALAWVDLAQLQKQGALRWVYGLQLPTSQATILKERVVALTDQRKRQLITEAQYVAGLQQLGIPDPWINALDAAADATLTPKTSAFAIPITGS